MLHWWDDLTFLHWRYQSVDVQRLLPRGLTVETFDGTAWVGLVPFFLRIGLPRVPSLPWVSRFPETNVRTYVRSSDGARGIWFFSLDAARLGAVLVARSTYRLPYFWAEMSIGRNEQTYSYRSRRRWPEGNPTSHVVVEVGDRYRADELSELDHFLTARWTLFSNPRSGLRRARASHDPWPLHRACARKVRDELVVAAGLRAPDGEPLVHFAPSVEVSIGWPEKVSEPGPARTSRAV